MFSWRNFVGGVYIYTFVLYGKKFAEMAEVNIFPAIYTVVNCVVHVYVDSHSFVCVM